MAKKTLWPCSTGCKDTKGGASVNIGFSVQEAVDLLKSW